MESLNPELALYGSNNLCTRTNTVLPPISEVSTGAVSLITASDVAGCQNKLNMILNKYMFKRDKERERERERER